MKIASVHRILAIIVIKKLAVSLSSHSDYCNFLVLGDTGAKIDGTNYSKMDVK